MKKVPFYALNSLAWILSCFLYTGSCAAQTNDTLTPALLREELARRDKVIIELLHRVEQLEREVAGNETPDIAQENVETGITRSAYSAADEDGQKGDNDALKIDPLAAERALERSLVQQGARLLPTGQAEISPSATYYRFENDFPVLLLTGGGNSVGGVQQTTDVWNWNVGVRVGLPYDSQLELNVPYRMVRRETNSIIGGNIQSSSSQTTSGIGDISLALAKHFLDQSSWRPNLVGRVIWVTETGENDSGSLALAGNGSVGAQVDAYWRRDPVVFLATGRYTHPFDGDEIRLGDTFDLSLGTSLAISPETAMTFSVDQTYSTEIEFDGTTLKGTDTLFSVLNISASTIMGRGLLMRFDLGVGLTEDAPDYRFGVSFPMRFDLR